MGTHPHLFFFNHVESSGYLRHESDEAGGRKGERTPQGIRASHLTSLIIKVLSPQAKYFPLTSVIRKIIQRYFTTMEIEKRRIIEEFSSLLQLKLKNRT